MDAQAVVSLAFGDLSDHVILTGQNERLYALDVDSDRRIRSDVARSQREAIASQQRVVDGLVANTSQVDAGAAHAQQDVGEASVSRGRNDHQSGTTVNDGLSSLEHVAVGDGFAVDLDVGHSN